MLRGIWNRFVGSRDEAAQEHEVERRQMTNAERRANDESVEGRQADLATQARLGGSGPERLLPDDDPDHR